MKIKKSLKIQNFDTVPHAGTQKGGVPEEAKIGRTSTTFDFLKYVLCGRHPVYVREAESEL